MPTVIIPHGGRRDGIVEISVNGDVKRFYTGVEIDVDANHLEVMDHAMIRYTIPAVGAPAGSLAASARVYMDFTTAEYYVDGYTATIADAFDQVYESDIVPGEGLHCFEPVDNPSEPQASDALLAAMAGAQTLVIDLTVPADNTMYTLWGTPTANIVELFRYGGQANLYTSTIGDTSNDNDLYSGTWVVNEPTRVAVLITADAVAVSCNGSDPAIGHGVTTDFNGCGFVSHLGILRRVIALDPVATSDLAALSAIT